MSSMPVFGKSALQGIEAKLETPTLSLLVSIEPGSDVSDDFWGDPLVGSVLNSTFWIVRLSELSDGEEISQLAELYPLPPIPCILYFAPNGEGITHAWSGRFPTPDEFSAFFLAQIKMPSFPHTRPPQAVNPRLRSAKISLTIRNTRVVREFPPNATLGQVREWIRAEAGDPDKVIVAHSNKPLPADDAMTVTMADLVPSAVLRIEEMMDPLDEKVLPVVPRIVSLERSPAPVRESWLRRVLGFVNPWPDVVEVEDFFTEKD
jgi:hypothetical protein